MEIEKESIAPSVVTLTLTRLVINMTRRFAYPFLPSIGRQLSVPLADVQSVIGLQAGIGVSSPFFGAFAERYRRKQVMMGGLSVIVIAGLLGAIMPGFWIFAVVMIGFGVGKVVFDPALQAFLGDRVPYRRRALVLGITELSWAGSLIVAAPLAGWLLSKGDHPFPPPILRGEWTVDGLFLLSSGSIGAVFGALALLAAVAFCLIWFFVTDNSKPHAVIGQRQIVRRAWHVIRHSPAALGALGFTFLLVGANEVFFINYGTWMERSFDLTLTSLGTVSIVIAAAEVMGELTVITLADRFGKRRTALYGATFAACIYLVLPALDFSLPLALIGIFAMILGFEMSVVASIPLFTEVLPEARSTMMSSMAGASSLGRLSGAALGGLIYNLSSDFLVVGAIAMLMGTLAVVCMWRFIGEYE